CAIATFGRSLYW
nr:immunoglobulin heavy chain junction region [Macaca mulatta]